MTDQWTRRQVLLGSASTAALALAGCSGSQDGDSPSSNGDWNLESELSVSSVQQYSSEGCSCCGEYASYLKDNVSGEVETTYRDDMGAVKREHGVPDAVTSCHTLVVDDYVVEGHVPAAAIEKLLAERPDIDGIALAGMPAGSPGMGGSKSEKFAVQTFSDGQAGKVFVKF